MGTLPASSGCPGALEAGGLRTDAPCFSRGRIRDPQTPGSTLACLSVGVWKTNVLVFVNVEFVKALVFWRAGCAPLCPFFLRRVSPKLPSSFSIRASSFCPHTPSWWILATLKYNPCVIYCFSRLYLDLHSSSILHNLIFVTCVQHLPFPRQIPIYEYFLVFCELDFSRFHT